MPRARLRAIATLAAAFMLAAALAARQVIIATDGSMVRDASGPPKGTAVVMGRTVDASSGKPVGDVVVSLGLIATTGGGNIRPVMSDDQGRFVVRDLPKGGFSFYAVKPGYVPGAYSKRLADINATGQLMNLNDGDRVTDVTITLWKYAVIDGTVTDESGDPIVGATVRALARRVVAGRSQLSMESSGIPFGTFTARTDDRGMYRLDSLPPGDYVVVVPVITWSAPKSRPAASAAPAAGMDATSSSSTGLLSWTSGGRGGGTGTGGLDVGDDRFGLVDLSGSSVSTPAGLAGFTADGRPLVYETQYFPGTASLSRATPVNVGSGDTHSAVDFHLKPMPALKISGAVSGPNGPAANLTLRLVSAEMSATSSDPEIAITTSDADGRFVFLGVTPGQYAIRGLDVPRPPPSRTPAAPASQVSGGSGSRVLIMGGGASPAIPDAPTLWTDTPVSLGDRDVKDVAVTLRPGLRISGHVEFDGTADRQPGARMPTASIVRADGQRGTNYTISVGRIDEQWRLTTYGQVPGQYIVQMASTMPNWYFEGAFLGGRDISIVPLDLTSGDVDGVVIKLTDKPLGSIAGTMTNSRAQLDDSATALIFPADRTQWINHGPNPRILRAVGSGHGGRYVADNMPPGDYLVAAVADVPAAWADPKSLDTLSRIAGHVTLRGHESATLDLRVAPKSESDLPASLHRPFVDDESEPQARDAAAPAPTGTGRVSGIVSLDAEGHTPASRVHVTLAGATPPITRTIITNETGRFDFAGLPAGRYSLNGTKPAHLNVSYGTTRAGGIGAPFVLAEGQQLTAVVLTIYKGGVITGMVRDERGQPMPGATVQLFQFRTMAGGERRLGSASGGSERTDDRGVYRIYGLAPGEYFVAASANYVTGNAHPTTAADVQFAEHAGASAPGSGPGATAGTPNTAPTGSATRPATLRYVPILYPNAASTEGAQSIKLGVSEERSGVDVTLRPVPTVPVEGTVVNSAGPMPANVEVRLLSVGETVPTTGSFDLVSLLPARPTPDGKFSFPGVEPGRYVVAAMTQTAAGRVGRAGADAAPGLWGSAEIEVNGVEISNVVVSLQTGMTVSGTLRFEATTATPPADLSTVRVSLSPVLTGSEIAMGQTSATAAADGSFAFTGLTPGRYNLRATPAAADARGWLIKGVSVGGHDVTDAPFEIKAGEQVTDAAIVFGDRPGEISGTLQDASGRPVGADYYVVLMPADPARWRSLARRVQQVRPTGDGKFTFRTLLAGDYLLAAATTDIEPGATSDPEFLTELSRGAVKLTLAEGEKKVQDLKIGK